MGLKAPTPSARFPTLDAHRWGIRCLGLGLPEPGLANVREGTAEAGGFLQSVEGQQRGVIAGEECDLEFAVSSIDRHPGSVLGATEGVVADEAAGSRDIEAVEPAIARCVDRFVEDGGDLCGLDGAGRREEEGRHVDGDFGSGDGNVAGDAGGGVAGGAPGAFFRLLRVKSGGASESKNEEGDTIPH